MAYYIIHDFLTLDDGDEIDLFVDNDVAPEEEPINAGAENRDRMELRPKNKPDLKVVARPARPVRHTTVFPSKQIYRLNIKRVLRSLAVLSDGLGS